MIVPRKSQLWFSVNKVFPGPMTKSLANSDLIRIFCLVIILLTLRRSPSKGVKLGQMLKVDSRSHIHQGVFVWLSNIKLKSNLKWKMRRCLMQLTQSKTLMTLPYPLNRQSNSQLHKNDFFINQRNTSGQRQIS